MQEKKIDHRETYRLVQMITTGNYKDEFALLKDLVQNIVDMPEFEINGGRIWQLDADNKGYTIKLQYGNVTKIPENYALYIKDQKELFDVLTKEHTYLNVETDSVLREKGVKLYSATAVGDLIKVDNHFYYKYIVSFNAPEIKQSFFETLQIISSVATIAIRNLSSEAQQEKISKAVHQASEIQKNLLPDYSRELRDYKIHGILIPDYEVGGDYFDYFTEGDEEDQRLGIVVSDAASKGLPAAIQALFVSGAIRMGKSFSPKIPHLMSRLNTLIFDTFLYERFVTLFYCELTLCSNRLVLYANAGHCEPIHYRPNEDRIQLLKPTGGLLGLVRNQKFHMENIRMHPGDLLVLYTDGITEAHNSDGEMFGQKRLIELVKKYHKLSPKEIGENITGDVQEFTVNSPYTDDKTIVVIKRDENSEKIDEDWN